MLRPTQDLTPLLGLPVPPYLDRTLGYTGDARYVAFYWYMNKFHWDDGQRWMGGAEWHAWQIYTQHPRIAAYFAPFTLYDEEGEARDWFVLDRETRGGYIGVASAVRTCLQTQYPPAPAIAPLELDDADWSRLVDCLSQTMAGMTPAEIFTLREQQTARESALRHWLDHFE